MGRKAPKKYEKMDWTEKAQFADDMMEKYGLERINNGTDITGRGGYDREAEAEAIARAMANDYDTRRSIEAAQLAGNKKANKLGVGISNISEAVNAERFMAKTHANRMDMGGSYDGANDEGGVTKFWVDKDRKKLIDSVAPKSATEEGAVEAYQPPEPGLSWNEAKEQGLLSEQAQEADERVDSFRDFQTSGEESRKRYTQQGAFDYLNKYKLDLTDNYVG